MWALRGGVALGVAPPTTLLGTLHSRGALVPGPRSADPCRDNNQRGVNYLCSHYRHINNSLKTILGAGAKPPAMLRSNEPKRGRATSLRASSIACMMRFIPPPPPRAERAAWLAAQRLGVYTLKHQLHRPIHMIQIHDPAVLIV